MYSEVALSDVLIELHVPDFNEAPRAYLVVSSQLKLHSKSCSADFEKLSSTGLWFGHAHHPEPVEGHPWFSAFADKVKDFYSKLGFEIVWEYPPKDQSGYLVMKRGNSILAFFCGNEEVYNHPFFKRFSKTTPRGNGTEVAIYIPDLD